MHGVFSTLDAPRAHGRRCAGAARGHDRGGSPRRHPAGRACADRLQRWTGLERDARCARAPRAASWLAPLGRARRPRHPVRLGCRGRSRRTTRRGPRTAVPSAQGQRCVGSIAPGPSPHRASRCPARRRPQRVGATADRAGPHRGRPGGDGAHARARRCIARRAPRHGASASVDWCVRCFACGARRPSRTARRSASRRSTTRATPTRDSCAAGSATRSFRPSRRCSRARAAGWSCSPSVSGGC